MPRIRTRETETIRLLYNCPNKSEAARQAGMARGTFYNRHKTPKDVRKTTIAEFGALVAYNNLDDEEIIKLVRMWSP